MNQDLFDILDYSLEKLDSQVAGLHEEYRAQMQCRKGCSGCCIDGFRIRHIEAMNLLKGFVSAPPEVANAIIERLQDASPEGRSKCPLLVDGACSLYGQRPSLCRAYGLMIELKENVSTCALNFTDLPKGQAMKVLDIAPYYILLDELSERLWKNSPNPLLATGEEPPNLSIRQFFEKFLNIRPAEAGDSSASA